MVVSDNTIAADGLSKTFENLGRSSATATEILATNAEKKQERVLDFGEKYTSAASS